MSGLFCGLMALDVFLKQYMTISAAAANLMPEDVVFPLPEGEGFREDALCGSFKTAVEQYRISPNFKFVVSADGKKGLKEGSYRPGGAFEDMILHPDTQDSERGDTTINWYSDGLVVEFKRESSNDPFYTRAQLFKAAVTALKSASSDQERIAMVIPKPTEQHVEVQEQLALYAARTFSHQHRTHLFQLLICGDLARFLLWDHSGAIVSEEFNYVEKPSILAKFIWHYNHMPPAARGYDRSARIADAATTATFVTKAKSFLADLKSSHPCHPLFESLLPTEKTLDDKSPVYKLKVLDSISKKRVNILVQRAFVRHSGAVGRGTRGYVAYCIESEEVGFLKDTWRFLHPCFREERRILDDLYSAKVKFIPQVLYGGDVIGAAQMTRSKACVQFQPDFVAIASSREFQHHRLFEEFALPVQTAHNSKVYTKAFLDAMIGMCLAQEMTPHGLLHRDISIHNIMIVYRDKKPVGVLCDWDHSGAVTPSDEASRQAFRTGTWQFMSIAMLQNPQKVHDVLDDYESFFWSFLYGAMHGYEHNKGRIEIDMFDERLENDRSPSLVIGGRAKRAMLADLSAGELKFSSSALTELIAKVAGLWYDFYHVQESIHGAEFEKAQQAVQQAVQPVPEEYQDDDPEIASWITAALSHDPSRDIAAIDAELVELRTRLADLRSELSDARTLFRAFLGAFRSHDWNENDACKKVPYPRHTELRETRTEDTSETTTHMSRS